MKKLTFTPEDFNGKPDYPLPQDMKTYIANQANEKLNKLIKSWPVVYAEKKEGFQPWHNVEFVGATHKARLVFIEELPKEPCKHEPAWDLRSALLPGLIAPSYFGNPKCYKCGVELVAEWKEKK